jgi:hypothetical protein
MKKLLAPITVLLLVAAVLYIAVSNTPKQLVDNRTKIANRLQLVTEKEKEGGYKRWLHEWTMLHDPATGDIPRDISRKESELLRSIQERQGRAGFRTTVNNTYQTAGPSQNGGRSRAVAFDMRTNQTMIAGGVSGGIFRSTNGGTTWTYVHPANESRIPVLHRIHAQVSRIYGMPVLEN